MPDRANRRTRPSRGAQDGAEARPRARARAQASPKKVDEDDAWNEIDNMKTGGEDGEFNKMNTNFYLKNGEEIDIVVLDESPAVFWGHVIKCRSSKGSTFYRTEQCQKSSGDSCVMCSSNNKAIGRSKKIIAFRVLDSRGNWNGSLNNGQGGLDGDPAPKIFITPIYLAKQFKTLLDDADGILSDKVIKLKKDERYQANFKYEKGKNGGMFFVDAPDLAGMEIPEILEVYKALPDDELMDFVHQFSDAPDDAPTPTPKGGGRTSGGSFGN